MDIHNYDDIINAPRHVSKNHPRMSVSNRAAQFAPFAALTGYAESINEAGRIVNEKKLISNEEKIKINSILNYLKDNLNQNIPVRVIYFINDATKKGGKYQVITSTIKKIDEYNKTIKFIIKKTLLGLFVF